jgi:uncharacterized protein YggE
MHRFTCSLVGLLTTFVVPLGAQEHPPRVAAPEVRTAASAQRSVPPNLATVTLQFTADGSTPSQAGSRLAARADSLRRALTTLGIPRDSLVSRSRWYWWRGRIEVVPLPVRYVERGTPGPDGARRDPVYDTLYRAHDAIEVRIWDLGQVGAVIDTALGRRVIDISGVQFTATDITMAQEDALREATARARRQAEAVATASGMQLGDVVSLSTEPERNYDYSPFLLRGAVFTGDGASADAGNQPTIVVRPLVPVSVTVYAVWALVRKP